VSMGWTSRYAHSVTRGSAATILAFSVALAGCAWQRVPEPPHHGPVHTLPIDVGVELSGAAASQVYGPRVIENLRKMGIFESIVHPYRAGDPVEATLGLSIDGRWRGSGFWPGFVVGLSLFTLSPVVGPGIAGRHEVGAALYADDDSIVRYEFEVASKARFGLLADTNEVGAKVDALQAQKIAVELAKRLQNDRNRILGVVGGDEDTAGVDARETGEAAEAPTDSQVADELERLTELWRSGALSDDEFARAKARLLGE